MKIKRIKTDKKRYLDLLLIADPSEDMIMKYLPGSDVFVMFENKEPVCIAAVLPDGSDAEIKNLATVPHHQGKGYGKKMMKFIIEQYKDAYNLILGTGGTGIPGKEFYQVKFYRECGFTEYAVIRNFFIDNYPGPIIEEDGNQCVDMVYMKYSAGTGKDITS